MLYHPITALGRKTVHGLEEYGYGCALLAQSLYWLIVGPFIGQPVAVRRMFAEMMRIGVQAIPIVVILAFTNGVMLAIQGIYTLKDFNAESQVIPGIALSVTREFAVLIVGIVVAGRSGSAIAARIGAMNMSQEIDALQVIGVNPIRYLVAPIFVAMIVMMPMLTMLADVVGLLGGGLLSSIELHISLQTYYERCMTILEISDFAQGLSKSLVFAVLISAVACINGFSVQGGAEGLGKMTTRSVVHCISVIVIADMIFTFFLSR